MNERITLLVKQATKPRGPNKPAEFDKEYFARLIVRECASIDFYKLAHIGTEDDYRVTQVIKEHFGVD